MRNSQKSTYVGTLAVVIVIITATGIPVWMSTFSLKESSHPKPDAADAEDRSPEELYLNSNDSPFPDLIPAGQFPIANLAFETPSRMSVGEVRTIELQLSPTFSGKVLLDKLDATFKVDTAEAHTTRQKNGTDLQQYGSCHHTRSKLQPVP